MSHIHVGKEKSDMETFQEMKTAVLENGQMGSL
jgi:hypothetical protein